MSSDRAFLVNRRSTPELTDPPEAIGVRIFYQWSKNRQAPFSTLSSGDTIYWGDLKTREIRWELRVRNVRRAHARNRSHANSFLRQWFGVLVDAADIYRAATEIDSGWLLAWENELVGPVDVTLPAGVRFGRNGVRELHENERVQLGLPSLGRTPLIPVSEIADPAPVFGPHSRRYIPDSVRREVFLRDGDRCGRCGSDSDPLHLDHVFPWSKGGASTPENLQVLCRACNLAKSATVESPELQHLLPTSELEALALQHKLGRPETVQEAASVLPRLIDRASLESAMVALMSTVVDLQMDRDMLEILVEPIAQLGESDPEIRAWVDVIQSLPIDETSLGPLLSPLFEFDAYLRQGGALGSATAAVHLPFLCFGAFKDELLGLLDLQSVDDAIRLAAQCPEPRLAARCHYARCLLAAREGNEEDVWASFNAAVVDGLQLSDLSTLSVLLASGLRPEDPVRTHLLQIGIQAPAAHVAAMAARRLAESCEAIDDQDSADFYRGQADLIELEAPDQ